MKQHTFDEYGLCFECDAEMREAEMSEMPERLNLSAAGSWHNFHKKMPNAAEYIRADIHKAEVERLQREVDALRLYGNKDCTAMADEALKEQRDE